MDTDGSGSLDKNEFLQIPQIASNPLAQRLLAVFDSDGSGDVDFKEFLIGINAFSTTSSKEDKLKCNQMLNKLPFRFMILIEMAILVMENCFWF
jgi:Ca2+-binding EF-hand superfamily protein